MKMVFVVCRRPKFVVFIFNIHENLNKRSLDDVATLSAGKGRRRNKKQQQRGDTTERNRRSQSKISQITA